MSLNQVLDDASSRFEAAGIETARVDAELLAGYILGLSRGELQTALIADTLKPTEEQAENLKQLIARREAREPLQHLTGEAHFRNITLKVGKGVFVPRPETEWVTQFAVDAAKATAVAEPLVFDLCAGSGAIGLAIASEVTNARVIGIEKSADAFAYTLANYQAIAPDNGTAILGDLSEAPSEFDGLADVVISNPPYIPDQMVPVYPEVALHDPGLALYGGNDGLDVVRVVSQTAKRLLHEGGTLVIEHADMQGEAVRHLLLNDGWRQVRTHQDFNGRDRTATAIR
ncbi:MAG: peptide chain release factor N(5)-glutamine methyltransferase [Microbacteriaceae bacterium]|nr:peptide chain release factor N(5)-glutamine methyltransferase [Microbacteriaceae bacterium]